MTRFTFSPHGSPIIPVSIALPDHT